ARTGLRVTSEESLSWWAGRFAELGVAHGGVALRDGRTTLDFEDEEGQRLSLVVDASPAEFSPWQGSRVPREHQIRGLGPILLSVPHLEPTEQVLTNVLGMRRLREYLLPGGSDGSSAQPVMVVVFAMGAGADGGAATELHVAAEPSLPPASPGAGGVHHVAFRTPTLEAYQGWVERLKALRIPSSGPVDRFYFRSLYFREPGGILFEIATDGPGFDADEPLAHLGERLALPPFLEPRRAQIEAGLQPL
ncbi:MAG: ring-cleaving dioxygenase, partial [Cytophagales bacterium]|nr:ring-cleaving dioxygenase [Armatimonadota bacterium]